MTSKEYLDAVLIGGAVPLSGKVILQEYDPHWPALFLQEKAKIQSALGKTALAIEHVGSTSVPGLCAKPILDIVLTVPDTEAEETYLPALEDAGYTLKVREPDWYAHRMCKGYAPEVNLHIFSAGCTETARMTAFRDHLRSHPEDLSRYAAVKRQLAQQDWTYLQDYADAKTEVISEIFRRMGSKA